MISILIPPTPHLKDFALEQPMDLLLAHLILDDTTGPAYAKFYQMKKKQYPESYFILDNGAHELEEGLPIKELLDIADTVKADEVVLPDKLFDGKQTYLNLVQALEELADDSRVGSYQYMIVPQGRDHREYIDCLESCLTYYEAWRRHFNCIVNPPVLGVSKDYHEMFAGGIPELLRDYIVPAATSLESEIHLLGWVKTLWDMAAIRREFEDVIRSTDSARPFTFAMNDISLETTFLSGKVPQYPGRPEDFFDRQLTLREIRTARTNSSVYWTLCKGD